MTTSEPPFPPHLDGIYNGTTPASLRIEQRTDGIRFRIEHPHQAPVMVDLSPDEVAAVVRRLTGGAP
jgi:hypothetical protein